MPIVQYENFLSELLYEETMDYMEWNLTKNDNCSLRTNNMWNNKIVLDSFPVLTFKLGQQNPNLAEKIREEARNKIKIIENSNIFTVSGYYWTKLSYIPWHNDSHALGGLTIYLNKIWESNYGGYFLYIENDEIKAVSPKKNRAIFQYGNTPHSTTPVHLNADMRYTIQCFFF